MLLRNSGILAKMQKFFVNKNVKKVAARENISGESEEVIGCLRSISFKTTEIFFAGVQMRSKKPDIFS